MVRLLLPGCLVILLATINNCLLISDDTCLSEGALTQCQQERFDALDRRLQVLETKQAAYEKALQLQSYSFMASTSVDLVNPANDHLMVFDHVMNNQGSAYHPNTGSFVVPVDGTYFFSFQLTNAPIPDHAFRGLMKKSDTVIAHSICAGTKWGMCGDNAVVHAQQGEDVYVILHDVTPNNTLPMNYQHCHFQGFLIERD